MALGDNFTADVFKKLDKTEITQVSRAMLEMESVPKEKAEEVLQE
ncbi:MAG: flagellar motor switch protein FliG, partial [Desulfonatronovibrionaceae bacterium]